MSLNGKTNEEKIWNYLKSKGLNDYGCAGLLGNLFSESGLNPKNLQNTGNKKLSMTDDEYVDAVDNGTYTNFIKDSFGYGIAQWTYHTRKKALYDYVMSCGKSIGDLEAQLNFLYKELSGNYKSVLYVLQTATSVLQASNAVLLHYEKPADQSIAVQNKRAGYGQKYYEKYANSNISTGKEEGQVSIKVKSLIELFEQMYNEHWSYEWGAARKGCVDCSGAFVYAYKQLNGPSIYHGSNAIARKYVGTMQPISEAKPGQAAFKWKKDGAPDTYTDGKGNYYHIGLVDSTGKYVLNAKNASSGFSRDAISSWYSVASLNDVDYSENTTTESVNVVVLYQAVVTTESGSLNFRDAPNGIKIGTIPRNATVDVLKDSGNWWNVRYDGKIGYVNKSYLTKKDTATNVQNNGDSQSNNESSLFNVGDEVHLISGATYASGGTIPSWVFEKVLYIRKMYSDRAVVSTLKTGAVTGTVLLKYLEKIGQNTNIDYIKPYNVQVTVNILNIRKGAGKNYQTNGTIRDKGIYTIVAESDGVGATKWLKLENGRGWISADYVVKV